MSTTEITNEQFRALFPEHDSRYIGQTWKDHTTPGYAPTGQNSLSCASVGTKRMLSAKRSAKYQAIQFLCLPKHNGNGQHAREAQMILVRIDGERLRCFRKLGRQYDCRSGGNRRRSETDAGKRSHAQVLGFPTENPERKRPPTDQLPCCLLPAQSLGIVRHERECGGMDSLRLHSLSFKRKGKQKDCREESCTRRLLA